MQTGLKLSFYYFLFGALLTGVVFMIFGLMHSTESFTSEIEHRLWRRNLGDIVDLNYHLNIEDRKDEKVPFLVDLTEFFYAFHTKTIEFKKRMDNFMAQRKVIIDRLDHTGMEVHEMSVIPNSELSTYDMNPRAMKPNSVIEDKRKQFPFSRVLAFNEEYFNFREEIGKRNDLFLMCTARIKLMVKKKSITAKAQISEYYEDMDKENYLHFLLTKNEPKIITLNRVLRIRDKRQARIFINGLAQRKIEVMNVEASCVSFIDVRGKND